MLDAHRPVPLRLPLEHSLNRTRRRFAVDSPTNPDLSGGGRGDWHPPPAAAEGQGQSGLTIGIPDGNGGLLAFEAPFEIDLPNGTTIDVPVPDGPDVPDYSVQLEEGDDGITIRSGDQSVPVAVPPAAPLVGIALGWGLHVTTSSFGTHGGLAWSEVRLFVVWDNGYDCSQIRGLLTADVDLTVTHDLPVPPWVWNESKSDRFAPTTLTACGTGFTDVQLGTTGMNIQAKWRSVHSGSGTNFEYQDGTTGHWWAAPGAGAVAGACSAWSTYAGAVWGTCEHIRP